MKSNLVVCLLALICLAPGPLRAQSHRWSLGATAVYSDFRGGLRDPGGITFEPSSRFEVGVVTARMWSGWGLQFEAGWANGHLSSRDSTGDQLQLDALGAGFDRIRGSVLAGIRILAVGEGSISVLAGPTFDVWHADDKWRPRLGAQARLALTAPVGSLLLENYLGYSLSGSPFDDDEVPPGFERTTLKAISVGIELRWRL